MWVRPPPGRGTNLKPGSPAMRRTPHARSQATRPCRSTGWPPTPLLRAPKRRVDIGVAEGWRGRGGAVLSGSISPWRRRARSCASVSVVSARRITPCRRSIEMGATEGRPGARSADVSDDDVQGGRKAKPAGQSTSGPSRTSGDALGAVAHAKGRGQLGLEQLKVHRRTARVSSGSPYVHSPRSRSSTPQNPG